MILLSIATNINCSSRTANKKGMRILVSVILLCFASLVTANPPIATVLVIYTDPLTAPPDCTITSDYVAPAIQNWKAKLGNTNITGNWPVVFNIETMDTYCMYSSGTAPALIGRIIARLTDATKLPVSAIIGPEITAFATILEPYLKIPIYGFDEIASSVAPFQVPLGPSFDYDYLFATIPPLVTESKNLFVNLKQAGAKTLVAFALIDPNTVGSGNEDTCLSGAAYGATQGMQILGAFNFSRTNVTKAMVVDLVRHIRDDLKPDVVMWCDYASSGVVTGSNYDDLNVLPILKQENYLPKALVTLALVDYPVTEPLYTKKLMPFVIGIDLWSAKLKGSDYTQANTPYSSQFRPSAPVTSVIDEMNTGYTPNRPSSNEIYQKWYQQTYGVQVSPGVVKFQGLLDFVEAAVYLAGQYRDAAATSPFLLPAEVFGKSIGLSIPTPYGRYSFDENRIQNGFAPVVLQVQRIDGVYSVAEVVGPRNLATSSFIYPMPVSYHSTYYYKVMMLMHVYRIGMSAFILGSYSKAAKKLQHSRLLLCAPLF